MPLTEDEVVESVAEFLNNDGWTVLQALKGNSAGVDIIAEENARRLHVEAKGSASIDNGTTQPHHQQHQTNSAIGALGKAMLLWTPDHEIALALPRERTFRNHVAGAYAALTRLGITVFWVADDRSVEWTKPHEERERFTSPPRLATRVAHTVTCREAVLAAARMIHDAGWADFAPDDIVRAVHEAGHDFSPQTIRTFVTSVMCVNAPAHHVTRYPDLERVGRGKYRLRERTESG